MQKGRRALNGGTPTCFLICLGVSAAAIVLLSVAAAIVASGLTDPTGSIGLISLAVMLVSAAISGIFSIKMNGDGGIGFSALVALAAVLIMLLINVILCAGKVSLGSFMNYVCYIGVAVGSAFVGKKRERRSHRRH